MRRGLLEPALATFNHDMRDAPDNPCSICTLAMRVEDLEALLRRAQKWGRTHRADCGSWQFELDQDVRLALGDMLREPES